MGRAALGVLAALAACAPNHTPSPGDALAVGDSLRGMVEVVGSEPGTQVVLSLDGGARAVTLTGTESAPLRRLSGLEATVWGRSAGSTLEVTHFAVRASSGVPAVEGRLRADGSAWLLETADGRRLPLPHLPAALRGRAGARIWLAGPLDRAPDSFGVID